MHDRLWGGDLDCLANRNGAAVAVTDRVSRGAIISDDGLYRYWLIRCWNRDRPTLNVIMLNPSTADAKQDDPTITRCMIRARAMGYGQLVVTNLFAFRSTDPEVLRLVADPVGPENDTHLQVAANGAGMILCAWGNHGAIRGRDQQVLRALCGWNLHVLGLNKSGQPKHPLYVPLSQQPVLWEA